MIDGSSPAPSHTIIDASRRQIINPLFTQWLRTDQMLRSLLFTTISGYMLVELCDLGHSFQIWHRLHKCFLKVSMAKSLELRRKLTNVKKQASQSMESFLRDIKHIVDSLAAINSPLTDQELIQYTINGLDEQYEIFITAVTYFGQNLKFDKLRNKLIIYKLQVLHLRESTSASSHQAFATTTPPASGNSHSSNNTTFGGNGQSNHLGKAATTIGVEFVTITAMVVEEVVDIQEVAGISNLNPHSMLLGDQAHLLQLYRLVLVLY